jgi:hypothetical protein
VIPSDRGQRFIRCGLSDTDPRFARYPPLPVANCQGYELRQPAPGKPQSLGDP